MTQYLVSDKDVNAVEQALGELATNMIDLGMDEAADELNALGDRLIAHPAAGDDVRISKQTAVLLLEELAEQMSKLEKTAELDDEADDAYGTYRVWEAAANEIRRTLGHDLRPTWDENSD